MATFVKFPGTAGNYIFSTSVNELNADTAHCQQSIGGTATFDATNTFVQSTQLTPVFGTAHGQCNVTPGSTSYGINIGNGDRVPVTEGQTFVGSVSLAVSNPTTVGQWILQWVGYTEAGSFVGLYGATNIDAPGPAFGPRPITNPFVVPAGVDRISLVVSTAAVDAAPADMRIYWDAALIAEGTDASWVPSLRVVGDIDERITLALADWNTVTVYPYADLNQSNFTGVGFLVASGTWFYYWGNGVTAPNVSYTPTPALANLATVELRITRNVGTGDVDWIVNDSIVQTDSSTPGPAFYEGSTLVVGASAAGTLPITGNVYSYERRDGVSGPIVARFDADDVPVAAQLPSP